MERNIENQEITVLLVSDNDSDIADVKNHLEETMGLSCHVWHCPSIIRSSGFFKKELPGIDIVLLDLALVASGRPREIFRQMQGIVGTVPIIVFTERKDHELALMVIEEGAADNITKGHFSTDPYKLRDTIEFSLARDRISRHTQNRNATNIIHIGKLDAANIKNLKEQQASALKEAMAEASVILKQAVDHGRNNLREAGRQADIILHEVLEHGKTDLRNALENRIGGDRRTLDGFGPVVHGGVLEQRRGDRREAGRHAAVSLKRAIESGENNLMDAKVVAAAALKKFHEESAESHREKDQIIHWMSGGYSMEKIRDTNS